MISFIEIKKAVNDNLKLYFPSINRVSGELKEGFPKPAFFSTVQPILIRNTHLNYVDCLIGVTIVYFPEKESELENLKIQEKLYRAFGLTLFVKDKAFLLEQKATDYLEGAFQVRFNIRIRLVYTDKKEEKIIMKQLKMDGGNL